MFTSRLTMLHLLCESKHHFQILNANSLDTFKITKN